MKEVFKPFVGSIDHVEAFPFDDVLLYRVEPWEDDDGLKSEHSDRFILEGELMGFAPIARIKLTLEGARKLRHRLSLAIQHVEQEQLRKS